MMTCTNVYAEKCSSLYSVVKLNFPPTLEPKPLSPHTQSFPPQPQHIHTSKEKYEKMVEMRGGKTAKTFPQEFPWLVFIIIFLALRHYFLSLSHSRTETLSVERTLASSQRPSHLQTTPFLVLNMKYLCCVKNNVWKHTYRESDLTYKSGAESVHNLLGYFLVLIDVKKVFLHVFWTNHASNLREIGRRRKSFTEKFLGFRNIRCRCEKRSKLILLILRS